MSAAPPEHVFAVDRLFMVRSRVERAFAAIGAFFDPWLVLAAAGLHLALDLFHGGIAPFWPLSGKLYYLTDFGVKGKPFWYYLINEG